MTYKNYWLRFLSPIGLAAVVSLAACNNSSNNAEPTTNDDDAGASGGKGGGGKGGTGGKGGSGGATSTGGKGGSGGATSTGGKGGSGGKDGSGGSMMTDDDAGMMSSGDCALDNAKKCFKCEVAAAKSNDEFLNRCTGATCTAYDNSKLKKLKDGKLPDLP